MAGKMNDVFMLILMSADVLGVMLNGIFEPIFMVLLNFEICMVAERC